MIMRRFGQLLFPLGLAGFVLAMLSFDTEHLQPLPQPAGYVLSRENEDQVYIEAKALTLNETRDYVNRDLMSRGFQPVLLQIDNTSPFSYELKKDLADIQLTSPRKIVREIGKSAIPRMIAYKVLGLIFWPLSIPGTIDSIRTWNKEYRLTKELEAKTLKHDGEVIPPYSSISRLLYVPKSDIKESFQLQLTNIENNRIEDFYVIIET